MRHLDPDRLALLALGERLDDGGEQEMTGHLAACAPCQREVRALRQTVELARESVAERDEEVPGPGEAVWDGIMAELRQDPAESPDWFGRARPDHGPAPAPGPLSGLGGRPGPVPGPGALPGPVPGPGGMPGPVPGPGTLPGPAAGSGRPPIPRRWLRSTVALAAAAAIGVLGTLAAVRPWQDRSTTPPPVASPAATLAPVPGGPGGVSGRAVVVPGPGGPELRLTTTGLPALNQGYYEVWVFDGAKNMVAVGVLGSGPTVTLPLPPTLDLGTFPVVDVSQEKYDGDQTHSETSVLRGTLTG